MASRRSALIELLTAAEQRSLRERAGFLQPQE